MSTEKSSTLTFDQAGHLMTIFKQKKVTKERFEAMKPILSDLCEAKVEDIDREDFRKHLCLPRLKPEFIVDYNQTLPQMIEALGLDGIEHALTDFFSVDGSGLKLFVPKLFQPSSVTNPSSIIEIMKASGYEPAGIEELLAYGKVFPNKQRKHPIIALRKKERLGRSDVSRLYTDEIGNRWLGFNWWGANVLPTESFLGIKVRK